MTTSAPTDRQVDLAGDLGRELDRIRSEIIAVRGAPDARYIHTVLAVQRSLETGGRLALTVSLLPPAWLAGTAMLTVAKTLENMELGHNILHGQWDWMGDPAIHSTTWEWDFATPADAWKRTHNHLHHTYTNVVGRDRDLGYTILRMSPDQPWLPVYVLQPLYAALLAPVFEWGIALYDLEADAVTAGRKSVRSFLGDLGGLARKAVGQVAKDYVLFPLLAGPSAVPCLLGNLTANALRNVWAHTVIFCGHFPGDVRTFTEDEIEGESRGEWYLRQVTGLGQHRGQSAAAPPQRQPQPPDRAPPLPRPAQQPLRRGRAPGAGDLRPVRTAVRHGVSGPAVRVDVGAGTAPRAAVVLPHQASWALAWAGKRPSTPPPSRTRSIVVLLWTTRTQPCRARQSSQAAHSGFRMLPSVKVTSRRSTMRKRRPQPVRASSRACARGGTVVGSSSPRTRTIRHSSNSSGAR